MDLTEWLVEDLTAIRTRFTGAIAAHVPEERWREQADGGGSSIAALVLHVSVHQDLAASTALGARPPLFAQRRRALGLAEGASALASLQEAEDPVVTDQLDLGALQAYAEEVHTEALATLAGLDSGSLSSVPATGDLLDELGGVPRAAAPWLHDMWHGKPAAWFVRWELIGHAQGHVGEMVSVRDRLGYRPF